MDNRINNLWWYQKTYSNLIEKGKLRGLTRPKDGKYYEKHHILSKCVGGTDEKENLVYLTYREHIIAHRILVELYPCEFKLSHALYFMINKSDYSKISSKELEKIRENSIIALRELNLGEKNPMFGKNISEDHKKYYLSLINIQGQKRLRNECLLPNWVKNIVMSLRKKCLYLILD